MSNINPSAKALIPTHTAMLNGENQALVNARELHTFLESKQEFSHWIAKRIEKYGFVEGQDYLIDKIIVQLPSGAKYKTDYKALQVMHDGGLENWQMGLAVGLAQSTVSKKLAKMRQLGLIGERGTSTVSIAPVASNQQLALEV